MGVFKKRRDPKVEPMRMLIGGLTVIIIIGTIILNTPMASMNGQSIGIVDALFTSTSAVGLTGLEVVDTSKHWTVFGKAIILLLIQIGGLGFMTMATVFSVILGKKVGLSDRLMVKAELNQYKISGLVNFTRYIIKATLIIETIGALLLSIKFIPAYGVKNGIAYSIFHSVSAYCNSGFNITGNSMESFVGDPIIILTMSTLILIGGLGFSVYTDIYINKKFEKTSLHTKIVLIISGALFLIGFILIFLFEYSNPLTLGNLTFGEKILAAIFQSASFRTAGFNSINVGGLREATTFFILAIMFIGGSPASTAGGVKTTTIGVLLVAIISVVKGKKDVEVFGRRLSHALVFRSLAIVLISFMIIVIMTIIMTFIEDQDFLNILFEVVSVTSTAGVTRGITPNLASVNKILMVFIMLIGKVGTLTFAFALAKRQKYSESKYRYPEEKIIVG